MNLSLCLPETHERSSSQESSCLKALDELRHLNRSKRTESPRLVVAQRKLARYQRLSDEKGLLANKATHPGSTQ